MKAKNPSKEFLVNSIKDLKMKMDETKRNIQRLNMSITDLKKNRLPDTGMSHETLWKLRGELKSTVVQHNLYKIKLNKCQSKLNYLYNEHNWKNITGHAVFKMFKSAPDKHGIMSEMNYPTNENPDMFVQWVHDNQKWDELLSILKRKKENE